MPCVGIASVQLRLYTYEIGKEASRLSDDWEIINYGIRHSANPDRTCGSADRRSDGACGLQVQLNEGLLQNVGPLVEYQNQEKPLSIAFREINDGLLEETLGEDDLTEGN